MRQFARGALPYSRLPDLYSSTPIDPRRHGPPNLPALNSRVFDALATGALVITDNRGGLGRVLRRPAPGCNYRRGTPRRT